MIILQIFIILILNLSIVFLFYFGIYRNNMVYKFRTKILYEDTDLYKKLPSYNTMVFKFWIPLNNWIK